MIQKIFLMGNPNVGKSVVFSRLTGVHVVSSNYPGSTVGMSTGRMRVGDDIIEAIDMPGVYSLKASSQAEEIAVSVLRTYPREETVVINVLDATNLERNLLLTLQLIAEGFRVVVCVNMCDDAVHRGVHIDTAALEEMLGVPVIAACAVTGMGMKAVIERIPQAVCVRREMRADHEYWKDIGGIVSRVQRLQHRHHTIREVLEDASVMPVSGVLIAAGVVYAVFMFVRFTGESIITHITDPFFNIWYRPVLERVVSQWQEHGFWFHLLIGDVRGGGIDFKQSLGVLTTAPYIEFGMVLPYVIAFYFMLSLLEDSGYLPRLAIVLDNVLHKLGLHGYAIIPALLGFGCNVPGILATRVLESKRERFIAATLISIGVPCVPLQAMIFGLLGAYGGIYAGGVYVVLFFLVIITGTILNRMMPGYSPEFLLEIPPYRFPPLGVLSRKLFYRVKEFLIEAIPVVLAGIIGINMLMYFKIFDKVTGFFAPLISGVFGLPQQAVAALAVGFLRKDVAVGMLMPLGLSAKQLFIATVLLAISFPCVATFMVLGKELGAKAMAAATMIMITISIIVGAMLNGFWWG